MRHYEFYSFQPMNNQAQPKLTIMINQPFPWKDPTTGEDWEFNRSRQTMDEQAAKIAELLMNSLPQGVIDRLVGEMIKRHANDLIINERWPSTSNEKTEV